MLYEVLLIWWLQSSQNKPLMAKMLVSIENVIQRLGWLDG